MSVNIVLDLDGVKGESTIDSYKEKLKIDSYSFGESYSGTFHSGTGGGGAGKVSVQDLHLTAPMSKASSEIFLACASGKHFKKAKLTVLTMGGKQEKLVEIELEELLVSSYQVGASEHSDRPVDQFSLNFSKITYKTYYQDGKGGTKSTDATWDIPKNKK